MDRHIFPLLYVGLFLLLAVAGCRDMGTDSQPVSAPSTPAPVSPTASISFSQHVLPILQRHGCTGCHGGNGGLRVGTVAQILSGGSHGPAVVAGQPDNSILIKKLLSPPPFGARMPQGGPYLPDSTISVLKAWIAGGALND